MWVIKNCQWLCSELEQSHKTSYCIHVYTPNMFRHICVNLWMTKEGHYCNSEHTRSWMSIGLVVMFVLFIHLCNFVILWCLYNLFYRLKWGFHRVFLIRSLNILQHVFIWLIYLDYDTLFLTVLVFLHHTRISMMFVVCLICCW